MKLVLIVFITALYLSFVIGHWSLAHASYVLPYPSYMPGNKLYQVSRVVDQLKKYWYFGNIAQIKYHLALADKYLVEAKTLMEYNQYLLASDALLRSDRAFDTLVLHMQLAKHEGKDVSLLQKAIVESAMKHNEILKSLSMVVPDRFTWTPEKGKSIDLELLDMLKASENLRSQIVTEVLSL